RDRSGASHSLTLRRALSVTRHDDGVISVDGTPTDCVHLALSGLFDELPDLVLSGINHGANMGDDVLYSGTVGAALEARFLGIPAIAMSLAGHPARHFDAAAAIAAELVERIDADGYPGSSVLNVNVPDLPREAIKGMVVTRLGRRHYSEAAVRDPGSADAWRVGPVGAERDNGLAMPMRRIEGIGLTSSRTRSRLVQRLRERGIENEEVLRAIEELPRHRFLEEAMAHRAYDDDALPIGFGQTISQPYVVARMTELALGERDHLKRILDVGTGCGYQAAVLSRFCDFVYSIERIEPLSRRAQATLRELRVRNVITRHGDGFAGWEVRSPFEAIVVAAAPNAVPPALVSQLAVGGRLVIPVGGRSAQQLRVLINHGDRVEEQLHDKVIFVPMTPGTR
ncbi:unnamed protein product, partial [Cyprideis torosa]